MSGNSECPVESCDYTGTEHGVNVHYGKLHVGTIAKTSECETCGSEYRIVDGSRVSETKYCSQVCKYASMAGYDSVQGWARGRTKKCEWCGDWFGSPPAADRQFCSRECADTRKSETGMMHGENSPQWLGGDAKQYCLSQSTINAVLERDEVCQMCGLSNDAHKVMVGCRLHIHHLKPRRKCSTREEANKLSNLLLLCSMCHTRLDCYIRKRNQATGKATGV